MTPYHSDAWLTVWLADCREALAAMEPDSVQTVITSPPYYGLRDYGLPPAIWGDNSDPLTHAHEWHRREWGTTTTTGPCGCGAWLGTLGLEPDPALYVEHMVEVFRAVRRVLRPDGTVWLNLGDSYAQSGMGGGGSFSKERPGWVDVPGLRDGLVRRVPGGSSVDGNGLKPKDRMMVPARVALALQADGWWVRDEIVWHKPNPMPSSVGDRTTPAHEMVYLLSKRAHYYYDADAIREPTSGPDNEQNRFGARPDVGLPGGWDIEPGSHAGPHRSGRTSATYREATLPGSVSDSTERQRVGINARWDESEANGTAPAGRNKRSVWVAGHPGAATGDVRVLPVGGTANDGSRRPAQPRRAAHDGECCGCVPELQQQQEGADDRGLVRGLKRSIWTIATQPYAGSHYATFPEKLVEPCILAGSPVGGLVLDPFGGSGTVAMVANRLGRRAVHIDLSAEYAGQAVKRIAKSRASGEGPATDMPVPFAGDGLWGTE